MCLSVRRRYEPLPIGSGVVADRSCTFVSHPLYVVTIADPTFVHARMPTMPISADEQRVLDQVLPARRRK